MLNLEKFMMKQGYQSLYGIQPTNVVELIPPYHNGTGLHHDIFYLFVKYITGYLVVGDMLEVCGQSVYVQNVNLIQEGDFLEEYTVVSALMLTPNPTEEFRLDAKHNIGKVKYRTTERNEHEVTKNKRS
jgi:hypothetical protein